MAVYTDVTADDLTDFLSRYQIGELRSYKGIAEGVENSNFLLHTSAGNFILTLYEKRVAANDLPFFLGLMEHLAARGITCPQPVKNRQGGVLGKLAGRPRSSPFSTDCGSAGRTPVIARRWARRWRACISPARIFRTSGRTRCRSRAGARSTRRPRSVATACGPACARRSPRSLTRSTSSGRAICPTA